MTRRLATLDGDWEGYLQRRSAHFRRNLRQAERRAAAAGVEFEVVIAGGAAVIDRAVAVERNSWKGQQGSGLSEARFASFYTRIAERVTPATRFRAIFARLADVDVAYILGAVRGDRYRGFQLSYHDDLAAMSLGHLLQARQLQLLAQEGIGVYDLGMDMPYKLAWSDDALTTYTLVVLAR